MVCSPIRRGLPAIPPRRTQLLMTIVVNVRRRTIARYFTAAIVAPLCALASCSAPETGTLTAAPAHVDTAAVAHSPAPSPPPPPPNIVFLLADDMRFDAIHAAGNPIIQTPKLDELAHQGVLFKNAYVTTPICAISRASIFTGQYASRHGILDFNTDFTPSQLALTYPSLLRAAGYRTGFIGKFGVGDNPPAAAFDFWKGFAGQGVYETIDSLGQPIHLTKLMGEQAIAFLQAQPKGKPFMLSLSFKSPHPQDEDARQFIPDPVDMGMYEGMTMPTPATGGAADWNAFPTFFKVNSEARNRWVPLFSTPEIYQTSVKNYYRLVSGMDRAVGEIRSALKHLGLDSNTVIIFASDNGFLLGEHGLSHKWYGFEESVRVPLLIYDPRDPTGQGGRVEQSIALNVDLAPTILNLASVAVPAGMQGQTLVPVLHGKSPASWRQDFLFEHLYVDPGIRRSVGVVGGRYKYLKYIDPTPNYEVLYDLVVDPLETTNLVNDPRYQTILENLRTRFAELAAQAR
jgi:arylsulfatase A-like enzyme